MNPVQLRDVTLRFGDLTAVDSVSLDVRQGEILGLLGHNGAGKTTLMRALNGLLRLDAGQIRVFGLDPFTDGHLVRATTGVLTEYPALDGYLSAAENLEVYAAIHGLRPPTSRVQIDLLLERLDLADKRDVPARELSAGLKQRLALARALVHEPRLLLLDEPTTNMDPVATRTVRDLLRQAVGQDGKTALLSTHDLAEAEELCDRVAIVRHGRLLSLGTPAELRRTLGGATGIVVGTQDEGADAVARALEGRARVRRLASDRVEVTGMASVPETVATLVAAGVRLHRVEPIEPTLEDLYLHLHTDVPHEVAG